MRTAPLLVALSLIAAGCAGDAESTTTTGIEVGATDPSTPTSLAATSTTSEDPSFPVSVFDDLGEVTIEERPDSVISLSATATEMLYAVGAGDQVVAVDDQSDFPPEAPTTELSGFTPNVEAILSYQPDLVIIAFDPADNPVSEGLESVGVPTLMLNAASTIEDVYRQMEVIGEATGNLEAARLANLELEQSLAEVIAGAGTAGQGVTYYHELDPNLFTVTSSTFIGEIYGLLGMVNISDEADPDGFGYPQVSAEFIVSADPDIIFLADAGFGVSAESLAERPGWAGMTALERGAVVELDEDISSRWGPRIVEFLRTIAEAVEDHASREVGS